jgi:GAF domain-containing protein
MKQDDEKDRNIPRAMAALPDEAPVVVRAMPERGTTSLDRAIADILGLMRAELVMDIVFISRLAGDDVVIAHATLEADETGLRELTHHKDRSFCQRVLDGRLPAVMPDVAALRATHDVPAAPITPGAYMATPVWLQDGTLYGTLCCLGLAALPELGDRHHQRLRMSARQIARLIDEAGGR